MRVSSAILEAINGNSIKNPELLPKIEKKVDPKKSHISSMIRAIKKGNLEKTKRLIEKGVDVNEQDKNIRVPLHVAAKYGYHKIVKVLINNGAVVDSFLVGPKGLIITPLCQAVFSNHLQCAKILLKHGATVSPILKDVCHPIQIAVLKGHVKLAALLLHYGAKVNLRYDNRFFEVFEHSLLSELWKNHNLPLLHCSILQKFDGMTKLLLRRGADINLKTSLGKTTLMQAVEANDNKLVRVLLKNGANPNDRDIFGQPVLHFVIHNANRKVSMYSKKEHYCDTQKSEILYSLVVSAGADVNARFPADKEYSNVVHYMIRYGYHTGVFYLLQCVDFNFNEIDLTTVQSGVLVESNLTPDIVNDDDYIRELKGGFRMINYCIMQWAIRRQMVGLPIHDKIILDYPIHAETSLQRYTRKMISWKISISKQIDDLKQKKIGNVTLWHLCNCNKDQLVRLVSNKTINFLKLFEKLRFEIDVCDYFMIRRRLKAAGRRKDALKKSAELIFNLLINFLPYYCCEEIVRYLRDDELQKIIR